MYILDVHYTMKVSVRHVEIEVNNKHLIVASCWFSLFIIFAYFEILLYPNIRWNFS